MLTRFIHLRLRFHLALVDEEILSVPHVFTGMVLGVAFGDAGEAFVLVEADVTAGIGVQVVAGHAGFGERGEQMAPEGAADAATTGGWRDDEQFEFGGGPIVEVDVVLHAFLDLMPCLGTCERVRAGRRGTQGCVDAGELVGHPVEECGRARHA